ncbi:MAG TPA: hypothetical protein VNP03_16770, partial [Pseudonocardia sp.]|nr:hypothetical protein [Pseudonocardia sp.]
NVLQVRNALKAESDRLRRLMALHAPMLQVGECGPDPVSAPAAGLFNAKIRAMVAQCNGYVRALGEAADALGQTAQSYGYNEGQIAASFQSYEDGQRSAPPAADPPAMAPNPSISYPGPNGAPR